MTAELVGDLRAAEHHGVRALGSVVRRRRTSTSVSTSPPTADGRQPRDVEDRRLLAVHDAEAVGDVDVGERGELVGELGRRSASSLAVSPALKRRFSSSTTSPSPGRVDGGLRALADRVGRERHVAAEQLAEAGGDGGQGVLVLGRALGPAEVGAHDDAGARLGQGRDRRDGGPDAAVVGDRAIAVERHVEVGPDQDALARAGRPGRRSTSMSSCARRQREVPTRVTRSTRRLE